jgi:putative PIN family toxin of toxin-antitoxin system
MAAKPRLRVFLDSNVFFSGFYSPRGAPGLISEHFVRGDLAVVVSTQVLEEVVRTFKRKLPAALPALRTFLVSVPPEVAAGPSREELEVWQGELSTGDAAIMAAAVASHPDYLVTGDNHFIESPGLAEKSWLRIVTPAQLIRLL